MLPPTHLVLQGRKKRGEKAGQSADGDEKGLKKKNPNISVLEISEGVAAFNPESKL